MKFSEENFVKERLHADRERFWEEFRLISCSSHLSCTFREIACRKQPINTLTSKSKCEVCRNIWVLDCMQQSSPRKSEHDIEYVLDVDMEMVRQGYPPNYIIRDLVAQSSSLKLH